MTFSGDLIRGADGWGGEGAMKYKVAACFMVTCLMLQACSSRPREFTPLLPVAANQADFDAAYATCQQLFVTGKLDSSGRTASAGAGAAAGAATAVVGSTAAAATAGYAGMAAAAATVVLLPFAILGGAWGLSRMKRAKKEHAVKLVLEGCLMERGYRVAGWSKGVKKAAVIQSATAPR